MQKGYINMVNEIRADQHPARDLLSDISQLETTLLKPRRTSAQKTDHQVAEHRAEIQRLSELAEAIEQAVNVLGIRLQMVSDPAKREALQHSRSDLERFKDEVETMRIDHLRTIDHLQSKV